MFTKRTDLALEAHELWRESAGETSQLPGVRAEKRRLEGYYVTRVEILDHEGETALGKPVGQYRTVDLSSFSRRRSDFFPRAVRAVGQELKSLLPETGGVLIVGLGNPSMTPDAIGSLALESVVVTRHLLTAMPGQFAGFRQTALLRTGVLGVTGMEAAEIVRGVTDRICPAAVIAIDALASRRRARLCTTVQISDTGILPGSGVGNHRAALTRQTLGVPVIAVGVPTVMDAATLAADLLEESGYDPDDTMLHSHDGLAVTPLDIDAQVRDMAKVIGYGIDWALQDLDIPDINALLA